MQVGMMVALVAAAFFVGTLWTKVQYLEGNGSKGTTGTGNAPTANNNAPAAADGSKKSVAELSAIAQKLGVNKKDFESCLTSGEMTKVVAAGTASGTKAGIQGTPGNIILDKQTGKIVTLAGAVPLEDAKASIDKLMAGTAGDDGSKVDPVTDKDHLYGNKNARYVLIEYSDFECPFCKRFHPTAQQLVTDYKGQLSWVYRHFPLPFHPSAQEFAESSECIAKLAGNDAFWKWGDEMANLN